MRRSQGTTLIEIVISLFILATLMLLFANLVTQYSRVIKQQDQKDRIFANIRMALDMVTSEVEEALVVYSPDSDGTTRNEVTLWRYDPEDADLKLTDRPAITVRYYLDSGTLYREVKGSSGSSISYAVAHEVSDFSIKREHSRLFQINFTLGESEGNLKINGKACLKSGI